MNQLATFTHPHHPFSVTIEADDRVAYAYLLNNSEIVGDVWLYNCVPAPDLPEWKSPARMPFLNPVDYAKDKSAYNGILADFHVTWTINKSEQIRVEIWLNNQLTAVLAPNAKPGWCSNAIKDGPLAKMLTPEVQRGFLQYHSP